MYPSGYSFGEKLFGWAIVGIAVGCFAWMILFFGSWGPYDNSPFNGSVSRQVTNFSYSADAGSPVANSVVLKDISSAMNSTFVPPTCTVNGRDVFNPAQVGSPQSDKGVTLSYAGKLGTDSITLPPSKVTHVYYNGKAQRVRLFLTKVVFYYDNTWDSLWTASPALGPKNAVMACMRALSPAQRGLVGLVKAVVFLPKDTPVPDALK